MLNGVGDEFVHDETNGHRKIGADDERNGVDGQRPGVIRTARRRRNFPTEIDEIPVKRDSSDVVRFMKLLMNGGDSGYAGGSIVELTRGGPCGCRRLDTICRLFLMR